jgi:hypothetical protein
MASVGVNISLSMYALSLAQMNFQGSLTGSGSGGGDNDEDGASSVSLDALNNLSALQQYKAGTATVLRVVAQNFLEEVVRLMIMFDLETAPEKSSFEWCLQVIEDCVRHSFDAVIHSALVQKASLVVVSFDKIGQKACEMVESIKDLHETSTAPAPIHASVEDETQQQQWSSPTTTTTTATSPSKKSSKK